MEDNRSQKKKFNFKKPTKKQQIKLTIAGAILAVLIIVVIIIVQMRGPKAEAASKYKTYTVKYADSLIFNGTVEAANSEEFFNDQSKGNLSKVLVSDGQEIPANTAVLAYQNDTMQEQVDEQQQQLAKLNLAVTTAQQNLDSANAKKQELENDKNKAASQVAAATSAAASAGAAAGDTSAATSSYDEQISAQDDVILQAQQALDAANLDLSSANQTLEADKNKVVADVSSTIDGIAIVDPQGKADATVPVVKIVSKATIVEAKVSEYDYQRVAKDQAVTVQATNSDEKVSGTITEVSKLPDASVAAAAAGSASGGQASAMANYSFKVKTAKDMQYGYTCQVTLPVNELRLPEKAVVKENDKLYVYLYRKGTVLKTEIVGAEENGVYTVTKGLKEKDRVISNPDKKLMDGQEVTVN